MSELRDESRALDRRLNAATDPAEMRALITRRRLVRAGLAFEQAMQHHEARHPVGPVRDSFPFVIR
jgi:hypothetical protein